MYQFKIKWKSLSQLRRLENFILRQRKPFSRWRRYRTNSAVRRVLFEFVEDFQGAIVCKFGV